METDWQPSCVERSLTRRPIAPIRRRLSPGRPPFRSVIAAVAATAGTLLLAASAGGARSSPGDASQQQDRYIPFTRTEMRTQTTADLYAVSAVGRNVAWAVGSNGSYTHTRDGGRTWVSGRVVLADTFPLIDVHAVDARTVYVLTGGGGRGNGIYRTADGGRTWVQRFTNTDADVRWRAMAFWHIERAGTPERGVAMADPLRSEFITMWTADAGWNWTRLRSLGLPMALENELAGSRSGTGLVTMRGGRAWFGTTRGRVLRTGNYGESWRLSWAPVTRTDSTGVASLAFRDPDRGIAFGASAQTPDDTLIAITEDGGATWSVPSLQPLMRAVSAGAYVPDLSGPTVVAVGRYGATVSGDHGVKWQRLDSLAYNSVAFGARTSGWAVGPGGRITKFAF